MQSGVEPARRSALQALAGAYAAGAISTATLERRIEHALRAAHDFELQDCLWDVPRRAPWWRRAPHTRPPRALIVEDGAAPFRVALPVAPGSLVIGRHLSCDVRVSNTSASRRHAIIARRGALCRIRDLGSSNGTTVNGVFVDVADLTPGDLVALGEVWIRVR